MVEFCDWYSRPATGGGRIPAFQPIWKYVNTAVNLGVGISSTGQICLVPQLLKIFTDGISPTVGVRRDEIF